MKTLYFATGNDGKFKTMRRYFEQHGVRVALEQSRVEMVEPQAETATEVALAKARQAYATLKQPVVVDDSSFHIAALGGFPGPYIKYMLMTIGIDGILEFLKNHTDRSAYFLSSLVYIDENGEEHIFEDEPYRGLIAKKVVELDRPDAWSDLHKVFTPAGTTKVLAELTHDELHQNASEDSYARFARWIKAQT